MIVIACMEEGLQKGLSHQDNFFSLFLMTEKKTDSRECPEQGQICEDGENGFNRKAIQRV